MLERERVLTNFPSSKVPQMLRKYKLPVPSCEMVKKERERERDVKYGRVVCVE